jgi:hypothetical protein
MDRAVFVKRHPLVTYFVLAYALTWVLRPCSRFPARRGGPVNTRSGSHRGHRLDGRQAG